VGTREAIIENLDEVLRQIEAARWEALSAARREDAYEVLSHVANALSDLAVVEREAVDLLRSWGGSWESVGTVYGISRQGAYNRFGAGS
jgi:hypothetical protein